MAQEEKRDWLWDRNAFNGEGKDYYSGGRTARRAFGGIELRARARGGESRVTR